MPEITAGCRVSVKLRPMAGGAAGREWAQGICLYVQGYRVRVRMDFGSEFTSTLNDVKWLAAAPAAERTETE
jgi:hypothetical protein